MLDYHQALQELLQQLNVTIGIESCPLIQVVDRILAQDISIQYDAPLFNNSAMDGYALAGDLATCRQWRVIHRIAAGENADTLHLKKGEAVRIFTGAPIPKNCNAVVPQEDTHLNGEILHVTSSITQGQHIRLQAEELTKGGILLKAQQRLTPAMIALAASQGYSQLPVFKPLHITVFSTGNELIEVGKPLAAGQIYDANRYLLLSWLQAFGHTISDGGILPDNQTQTEHALTIAEQCSDIIITSGGVSVGEEDHLRAALTNLGKLVCWKLAIKPGKPFAWGEINNTKVFMLPGNPVASLVTFQQLVVPALQILSGILPNKAMPHSCYAKANFSTTKPQNRREFLRVQLQNDETGLWANRLTNQGSNMLSTCITADALAEIPPNTTITQGEQLIIYPLHYKV